jgi:hypothetical protein
MTVTAVTNLAVKVQDIDGAVAWYRGIGAIVDGPVEWAGAKRADVRLGALELTLFTRALYEGEIAVTAEGFLHAALMSDDLNSDIAGMTPLWGPEVIRGPFGVRRVVFVDAPGGIRLEFMEQLDESG